MAENLQTTRPADEGWTTVIRPKTGWFDIDLQELWRYRDLIMMFVKRNFTVLYKQTILGPAWIILNPLITTVIFNVVFGGMAATIVFGLSFATLLTLFVTPALYAVFYPEAAKRA